MNLVFIAPVNAGKGTISSMLNEKYGMECISMGQLLRNVDPETELGKEIRALQSERKLVGNDIVERLLKEYLTTHEFPNGFILDGFPREIGQVHILENIEKEINKKIDYVIYLNVDHDIALKRTLGRRNCPQCGKIYNVLTGFSTPKNEGLCDECGVELVQRADDNAEAFEKGWNSYNALAEPCLEYYKNKGILREFDANISADETFKQIKETLGLK